MAPPNNGNAQRSMSQYAKTFEPTWATLFWAGVVVMAIGIIAITLPLVTTVLLKLLIGWALLIAGIVQVINAIQTRHYGGFWIGLIIAAFSIIAGLLFLTRPMVGLIAITMLFAAYLLVQGVSQIAYAMEIRSETRTWWWVLISGIASIALGILIWVGLPGDAAWIIGLMLGIYLLLSGSTMVVLALAGRQAMLEGIGQEQQPGGTTAEAGA